jgi:hypothetical protein
MPSESQIPLGPTGRQASDARDEAALVEDVLARAAEASVGG